MLCRYRWVVVVVSVAVGAVTIILSGNGWVIGTITYVVTLFCTAYDN